MSYEAFVRNPAPFIVVLHAVATWYMVGLIWFVQVVHYPLKMVVGKSQFAAYQERHMSRTSWVVGPPMLIELITVGWLGFNPPSFALGPYTVLGAILLGIIWGVTGLLMVPFHNRLLDGYDESTIRKLCRANWFRTIGWSLRGLVALALIEPYFKPFE